MEWAEVLADPTLRDLPYKIELDHYGRIVMSPASNQHGELQARLAYLLTRMFPGGKVISECSIATPGGVKVADVAWASPDFARRHGRATPFPAAPDLCVEIASRSNSAAEMAEKVSLYLNAGAREVWLVRDDGAIAIHGPEGERTTSVFPDAPEVLAAAGSDLP
jgi:Uma2 family endonuclease